MKSTSMFDYELYLVTKLDVYSLTYECAQNVKLTWIQKNRKPSLVELQNLIELKKPRSIWIEVESPKNSLVIFSIT